ncbi:TPA: helix-turn-helix transcriptional regulator [Staphylococcus aureus]|uniref:helix-turn-helix transcriptional regulator n=1 Tax=Staphylococcus aureus TaxID=1280 RepID=UPI001F3395D7|nr:helix-turn-helix domain-containing protein [Staphylococcus aureus]MCE5139004.1 helix-turn-helix domain-containing protein [Staphylococcus aureus]MCE5147350.1 helix-turn-helix domain-containing protein [Staphylococcus aureus]
MNKIAGYRKMLGKSQKSMAQVFNISKQSYRMKENGYVNFNKEEMLKFKELLQKELFPSITIDEIFF